MLKVACSGPGVSRTRNLLVTSPILYHYPTAPMHPFVLAQRLRSSSFLGGGSHPYACGVLTLIRVNPLMGTLKLQSNATDQSPRPRYTKCRPNSPPINGQRSTMAVDGWTVTFGIARSRGLSVPTAYYSMWQYNYLCALKG